jgi:uncharacterized coiled-coil protein SlyX
MDEYQESNHHNGAGWSAAQTRPNRWLVIAVLLLLGIAVMAFAYGLDQQSMVRQLTTQNATENAAMNQMQGQLNAVTAKLRELTTAQASSQPAATSAEPPDATIPESPADSSTKTSEAASASTPLALKPAPSKPHAAKRRAPVVDKKYVKLQAQLAEQEKKLQETQDEVAKNRSDLEGTINSTRDDLNGSIAKTHDELVVLEKRGERSYFEFDLNKEKQFQRVGPLTLSLRKTDMKHKSYDVAMIVDDNELQKKKVNLYEPIWIHTENDSQPVQIIVNRIDKDAVHGYISAPKYKPSELAAVGSASVAPVSTKSPVSAPVPSQPQQPQQ